VDVGRKNLAYVHIVDERQLVKWELVDLKLDNKSPQSVGTAVAQIVRRMLTGVDILRERVVCVIENQVVFVAKHPRGNSISSTVNSCIASALYATLLTIGQDVRGCSPKSVQDRFNLGLGRGKKQGAVRVVKTWLGIPLRITNNGANSPLSYVPDCPFLIPEHLKGYFAEKRKQDDLADCLLQAAYFILTRTRN
jgi:hypothetical protein